MPNHFPTLAYRTTARNRSTGEITEQTINVPVPLTERLTYPGGFRTVSREVDRILSAPKIPAAAYQLYHYLNARQERQPPGRVYVGTQRDIAAELQLGQSAVSRAFTTLRHMDLIYPVVPRVWQLNPMYGFNAGGKAQKEALLQVPAEVANRVRKRREEMRAA